jgi:hypothetical protein
MDVYHDTSHIDAWLRGQRAAEMAATEAIIRDSKARYVQSYWKPLLAGAAGAAIICAAIYASPKFLPREYVTDKVVSKEIPIEIPKIITKDVTIDVPHVTSHDLTIEVPHVVTHDVTVDHVVPRDVPVDRVPHDAPVAQTNPPAAPTTPMSETQFKNTPDWKDADIRGRILRTQGNGFIVKKDDGSEEGWVPSKVDPTTQRAVRNAKGDPIDDPNRHYDITGRVGDLVTCHPVSWDPGTSICDSLTNGVESHIPIVPNQQSSTDNSPLPTHGPAASDSSSTYTDAEFKNFPGYRNAVIKGHVVYYLPTYNTVSLSSVNGRSYTLKYDGPTYKLHTLDAQPGYCDTYWTSRCFVLDKDGHVVDLLKVES